MKRSIQNCLVVVTALVLAALGVTVARGQQPAPTLQEMRLASFVDTASARASEYFTFFKDLTAEETKIVEQFRENGEVSKRRQIVSDLIVYKSLIDNGSIAEYRDVKSVDGTPIAGREPRVQALFEKQSRAKSVRDELKRINIEGSRYDFDYTVSGLTMSQGLPLQPWARALFSFKEAGSEVINGRETVILSYQQVAPNSRFGFNLSLPSELRSAEPLFRGWLWLEPGTARLVKEVREVTVHSSDSPTPVVVQRLEFRYEPSRFDVLLPKRIVFSWLGHFSSGKGGVSAALKYRLTFSYGEFRRFTATSDDVQLADADAGGVPQVDSTTAASSDPPIDDQATAVVDDADLGPEFGPDAPTGPPETTPPSGPASSEPAVRRAAPPPPTQSSPRQPGRARPAARTSIRLTVDVGLPASAALSIPSSPIPVPGPSAAGNPSVPIPPPPLAPGEKPKFRPPPS